MFTRTTILLLLLAISAVFAAGPPPELSDPFLDKFVGDWQVEGKMGNRGVKQTSVHCEWVLDHHFIEFQYGPADAKPEYEAFVFIGFDEAAKTYVCHWIDVFGGKDSELGRGKIDDKLLAIEFSFGNGDLADNFTFDPNTKTWTSSIRLIDNEQPHTF